MGAWIECQGNMLYATSATFKRHPNSNGTDGIHDYNLFFRSESGEELCVGASSAKDLRHIYEDFSTSIYCNQIAYNNTPIYGIDSRTPGLVCDLRKSKNENAAHAACELTREVKRIAKFLCTPKEPKPKRSLWFRIRAFFWRMLLRLKGFFRRKKKNGGDTA